MLQSPHWSRYGARRALIAALRTVQILRATDQRVKLYLKILPESFSNTAHL
jgi:hypothetical protein